MRLLLTVLSLLASADALQLCSPISARHTIARRRVASTSPEMAVSKAELVDAIAQKAGVSQKTASLVLASTLDIIVESVATGNKVSLVGFGTFDSRMRPERKGRNPKTGESMTIKAAMVPSFSFGKGFKDAVKEAGASRQGKE